MKKKKSDLKDLENLVTPTYACCWKEIGVQLNIPTGILNSIEIGFPTNPTWCCNRMWINWNEIDPQALWDRVIKAIDSPAVSAMMKSFTVNSVTKLTVDKTLEAVSHLSCRLKVISINNRYKAEDDNWPLTSPKHFTSVALIHHKERLTEREVLAVATLQNKGDIDLRKIHSDNASKHVQYLKQSKCTKSISDIFAKMECKNKSPSVVLIEGVPGIGKTVLSKEIVFQWANGELLPNITLMFLIHLRDTESHKITSLESFVNYVSYSQVAEHVLEYITNNEGKNIMIVFDGYDELPEELRTNSFLYKMMTQKLTEIPSSNVVITSRTSASAPLHDKVDLRVEVLGFTNEDRKEYIVDALKYDNNKIKKVMKYLNNNPAINAYCYIPLNMTILLSFFESSDDVDVTELPNTQTGINEKFICTTISRYIRKFKGLKLNFSTFSEVQGPCDGHKVGTPCVGHEKGVPYGRILKEISMLAFKALEKDKIVFTTAELQENRPCLESQAENWNGLGLLKAVQLFTVENNLRNISFNFLHFTVQEILAAYYITLMSEDDQLKCMKHTFWDNRYYNTWIMYVGLMKNRMPIVFKHFLSGNKSLLQTRFLNWLKSGTYCHIKRPIINDKIKCLHLFQCFSEAENDDLCQYVGQLLQENEIDLSGQTLSAVNILTICFFLTRSTTKHWKVLNLSECSIGDDGIKQLHNSFTSNNRSKVRIEKLNLLLNNLTQSSVESIAGLILEWNVKDIIFNEISQNNLYQEVMHQVMQHAIKINNFIACNFNKHEVIFARLSQSDYLILSISSTSGKKVQMINNTFTDLQVNNDFNTGRRKMIIHALNNYTTINYLNLEADISPLEITDMVALIANNNFMEYLCLPKMQHPGKFKLKMIIDALKSNKSLQYVDMSLITIDSDLISDIAVIMNNNSKLKEIKVSKLVLRDNDFQHLGNFLLNIIGLKSLTITGYNFTGQDANKLEVIVKKNCEIRYLNLSNCEIPIVHLLNILSYKYIMENLNWLDLSTCYLLSEGMRQILNILKKMKYLQHVDLSANFVTNDVIDEITAMIKNNQYIQALSLPNFYLDQEDLEIISQAMQTISTLQCIDFNVNQVNNELAKDIATLFANNSELKQIRFAKIVLNHNGFQELINGLAKLRGVEYFCITDCKVNNHDVALLETFIYLNHQSIRKITITNCNLIENRVATTVSYHFSVFDQLELLDLSNSSTVNSCVVELLVFLSCSSKLKLVALCNCQLRPDITKQILMVLKYMRHLEAVDLSGNDMTDDSVSDMEAMIVNNKQLQGLCLPNCVLNQSSLRNICQALQTLSSLQYIDLSTNKIDSELASDIAVSITKNSKLKEFKISKLILIQSSFHLLKNYLVKFKGLTAINFISCTLIGQNAKRLVTVIKNNSEIQELNLSNCIIPANQSWSMLSCITKLKYFNLSQCLLQPNKTEEIFGILKRMNCLQHVDLSGNAMWRDVVNDVAAMIKNNQHIQSLSLPNGIISKKDLKIIIQAMQTVSSLQYVDFSTNEIDNELASDISSLLACNNELVLKFCGLTLKQSGFQHLTMHFGKLKGIKCLRILDCTFTNENMVYLKYIIGNNHKIRELLISNCKMVDYEVLMADNIGRYDQLEILELNNISAIPSYSTINPYIHNILVFLSCSFKLRQMTLCNCQLRSDETKQVLMVLKYMRHLETVDLSGNDMTDDSVSDMEAMIVNNKQLQGLCLPNCVFKQFSLKIICQALKTLSSLQYIDLGTNKLDSKLASDINIAVSVTKHNKLKELKISELTLFQTGFQHLNNYLVKIKGLTTINIINCSFIGQDAEKLVTAIINNNSEIQEFNLSNCIVPANQSWSMLSHIPKLEYLNLSRCLLQPNKSKNIFGILKRMNCLQHVDLSANNMESDAVSHVAAMIKNNQDIQVLSLPNCVLGQKDLMIIIQAMQTVSSLEYVDFNNNTVDNELASDVALLFTKNSKLKELRFSKFSLSQNGFQHLNNCLVKIKGLTTINIINCSFIGQDAGKLVTAIINNNSKIQEFNLSNCIVSANQSWSMLSYFTKLNYLNLSQCLLQPNKIKEIFGILKCMNCLQHIDLSGNNMESDAINDVAAMIKNNEHIQSLSLPNGIITKEHFKIIIQAMQTVSSLEYVNFNNNTVDDELASDVALLFTKNSKLKEFRFTKLTLNRIGFQHLNNYLVKIKGLTTINIIGCPFSGQNAVKLVTAFSSNSKIQELNLSNCTMPANQSWSMLSCILKLKYINLSQCQLQPNKTKEIFAILKWVKCLQHVDLSGNNMESDAINDVAAMIKNNEHIQSLSLPNGIINIEHFKIIIQAMQTVSSLEYVDFNNNTVDTELASDVALLFTKNSKLKEFRFTKLTLNQVGFHHLNNYLVKIKGLTTINIINCSFIGQDAEKLVTAIINNNSEIQEFNLSNCIVPANQSWSMLSRIPKLKYLNLSRCLLQPNKSKNIFGILKRMNCLQHVDLSANNMESDAVSHVAAMIKNNQDIQVLSLPNCVLGQKDLMIIIQAMQTVSSLEYVDFNNNTVDNELASDVALLFTKNTKMKEFRFTTLELIQSGFQHLNNCLVKIKGLATINIIGCSFVGQNAHKSVTAIISNNLEIKELNLLNCIMPANQSWSMLSHIPKLKYLNLSQCLLQPNETKEIFSILKCMKYLEHVDLSGNIMNSDAINDFAAMIKNNVHIQSLSLPNDIISIKHFKIIIQAMQAVSSLQYVDFSTNEIDNELVSDISTLFTSNSKLEEINFCRLTLKESGFQHLMMHFAKVKGIKCLSISDCTFTKEGVVFLKNIIGNNLKIKKMLITNCKMIGYEVAMADNIGTYGQLETLELNNISVIHPFSTIDPYVHSILVFLSCSSKLRQMTLCNCQLRPDVTKQILMVLKYMRHLETVDLSGNDMTDGSVSDMEAMIVNNKQLQKLCLPNCVLNQASLKIICQALQGLSSLRYVDFRTNKINQESFLDLRSHHVKIVQESS